MVLKLQPWAKTSRATGILRAFEGAVPRNKSLLAGKPYLLLQLHC